MQVFAAGLIDKTLRQINAKLQKKLVSECKKALTRFRQSYGQPRTECVHCFVRKKGKRLVDQKVVDSVETGRVYRQFKKYYADNESRLRTAS